MKDLACDQFFNAVPFVNFNCTKNAFQAKQKCLKGSFLLKNLYDKMLMCTYITLVANNNYINFFLLFMYSVAYGCGVFDFHHTRQTVTLQQCSEQYLIKCYISCPRDKVSDEILREQRLELLQKLKDGVKSAHSRLTPKATEPVAHVHCPLHDGTYYEPHLLLDGISWGMVCRKCNNEVPFDAYGLLMETVQLEKLRKCIYNFSAKIYELCFMYHIAGPVECAIFIDEIQTSKC